ncbi:hypothetical protein ABID30_001670 [Enterococcus rotai]|uniref:Thiopeptide-type bacteriocin biosynthesis domain-containing protein n=1 Tax=Enterococcus rotai TaxID=118060 RepID=A0A0U2NRR2_9ENTE|nr:hypothetical protein [Enterococcus rotai]ALS37682.1 hypothetical protein ATZ35_11130 [Enterococcus rotai]
MATKKYYKIDILLNAQKKYKTLFIAEYLIPILKKNREISPESRFFFQRTVDVGPIIRIYFHTHDVNVTTMYELISKVLKEFYYTYSSELRENSVYSKQMLNIKKMNRLSYQRTDYVNYTVDLELIEQIDRKGEYLSENTKKNVNDWWFQFEELIEDTFLYLYGHNEIEQMKFLVSLFYICSKKLDNQTHNGYLSFKSHYLGFVNNKRNSMKQYDTKIREYYEQNKEEFAMIINRNSTENLVKNDEYKIYLRRWEIAIEHFTNTQAKEKSKFNILNIIPMLRFRKYSDFHNEAFKVKKLKFYLSNEFQRYRSLVNQIYLLLPSLGFNTVKRLIAAYSLTRILEEEE